ncbi:MAG: gamma-glutamyl-gamma-aminobutyrate hydrolase family protein [Bacillota bacterium]
MRPLIGITCSTESNGSRRHILSYDYVHAVGAAGGDPVILPPSDAQAASNLANTLDGILLSGGVDIDPRHFGEDPHPRLGSIDPERDDFELALVRAALQVGTPLLAICRGIQVLNVAAGGTLFQDIPSQMSGAIKHRQDAPRHHASHRVTVERHSKLAGMVGAGEVLVNSFHHQAVRDLAPGFIVSARATDGVIEGIESTHDLFVVGVQWHPESMTDVYPAMLEIFATFVAEAIARR